MLVLWCVVLIYCCMVGSVVICVVQLVVFGDSVGVYVLKCIMIGVYIVLVILNLLNRNGLFDVLMYLFYSVLMCVMLVSVLGVVLCFGIDVWMFMFICVCSVMKFECILVDMQCVCVCVSGLVGYIGNCGQCLVSVLVIVSEFQIVKL